MKMIIKQPSLCAVVLTASCSFCADRVAAESASLHADQSGIDNEDLCLAVIPYAGPIAFVPENLDRTGPEVIEPLASEKNAYLPRMRIAMSSKHEINRVII